MRRRWSLLSIPMFPAVYAFVQNYEGRDLGPRLRRRLCIAWKEEYLLVENCLAQEAKHSFFVTYFWIFPKKFFLTHTEMRYRGRIPRQNRLTLCVIPLEIIKIPPTSQSMRPDTIWTQNTKPTPPVPWWAAFWEWNRWRWTTWIKYSMGWLQAR